MSNGGKTGGKNKCFDQMALEFCELINHVEIMKDSVLEAIDHCSKKLLDIVLDFDKNLLSLQENSEVL